MSPSQYTTVQTVQWTSFWVDRPSSSENFLLMTYITVLCVCVFFPSILDIKFVGRTSRGHTGGRSHRIFNPPSFCGACLDFCREKDFQPFLSLVDREVEFCVLKYISYIYRPLLLLYYLLLCGCQTLRISKESDVVIVGQDSIVMRNVHIAVDPGAQLDLLSGGTIRLTRDEVIRHRESVVYNNIVVWTGLSPFSQPALISAFSWRVRRTFFPSEWCFSTL